MGCLVGSHEGVSVKGDEIFIKHIQTNSNFVHISYTVITLYLITLHKWYFFKATLPPVLQNKFLTFLLTGIHPHSGVLLSQELKIHLLRTQSSKGSAVKAGAGHVEAVRCRCSSDAVAVQ